MKNVLLVFALGLSLAAGAQSKDSARNAAIKEMIESQNYVFQAQTAVPAHGYVRSLTAYSMQITTAKIDCNLK